MKDNNYIVIVAGGSGTRLWPISRKELPKQMQSLVGQQSLLEDTYERLKDMYDPTHIFVSTTSNYVDKIRALLPDIPADNFVVEPIARGPALAFALFTEVIYRRNPDAVIFSMASDHVVSEKDIFHVALKTARDYVAQQPTSIALVGVKPTRPDTGLGYIKVDSEINAHPQIFSVEKFIEKPSLPIAQQYVQSGDFYWNVAYYCYRAKTLLDAYVEASPASIRGVREYLDTNNADAFNAAPLMAHEIEVINTNRFPLVLIPAEFSWDDIGNWSALHDLLADTNAEHHGIVHGNEVFVDIDSHGCMIRSENPGKLIATVGLEDIVIIDTGDSLLVMNKHESQGIKRVIDELKQRGLDQYL